MRAIQKKINLEAVTSRLPGVVPAYREGVLYRFSDEELKKRDNAFPSNYGMIPMFVDTEQFGCLSWERISDWYHFFTDYYHLLNDWSHCGMKYASAVEYYAHESKNGYASQMKYGTDEYEYQELDRLFAERGGKVKMPGENDSAKDVTDEGFFKYICEYLVPSIDIPSDYKDYWHASKLFYPDIIKWKAWFTPRNALYSGISKENIDKCKEKDDCCDCTEYVNRGGKAMSDLLDAAYEGIQGKIESIVTCNTRIMTDVSLQVSLDDLGEFSIFSNEYELGTDYRVAKGYGVTENTEGGTVVAVDGSAMKLSSGCGFTFNEEFMEKNYDEGGWSAHTGDYKIDGFPEEDEYTRYYQDEGRPAGYYGFDHENSRVTGETEEYVRSEIKEEYEIEPLNAMYINDVLYDIYSEEYGFYNGDDSRIYFVYREEYTQTPYTIINGKKIYADAKPQTLTKYFYFPFFTIGGEVTKRDACGNIVFNGNKYKWFPRQRPNENADLKEYITYGGTFRLLTTDDPLGVRVKGRFYTPDGTFYLDTDNEIYTVNDYGWFTTTDEYIYDAEKNTAKKVINTFIPVYNMSCVSGRSASKLYELRASSLLTDDTGEVIPGRYDISDKLNQQPAEGDVLDLIYEVGNTNRVVSFPEAGESLYFGDIISAMTFYYKDYDGNRYGEVSIDITDDSSIKTSLSAINESTSAITEIMEDSGNTILLEPDIYCMVDYLIGTTLSGKTITKEYSGDTLVVGTKYMIADPSSGYSNGVHYTEEVQFVKTEVQYKLATAIPGQIPMTENDPTAHKLCYPVACYVLKQKESEIESTFGNRYMYALADFKMCFPPYSGWTGYKDSLEIFPVFRQEYLIGSSTMQKLDVDIYIDRGINAAYEKHLKLGEVTSMEALEQYGLNYFKMIEN